MRWVTANNLESWARTLAAETELPGVVSDLIRASVSDIATIRFPSGDKGRVRGFDGHLISNAQGLNVPIGESFWEFGTNEDYKRKANEDFNKRTAEVHSDIQAQSTLVIVSPWTWDSSRADNKIEDWIATAKNKDNSAWRDVRYIDGSMLETWLDDCPAVAAWHAYATFGVRPPEGVRSTEEFWQHFAGQFGPELTEEVILCDREAAAKQLLVDLMQPFNVVQLVADSPDEAVAFAVASIRKADPAVRLYLEARTLIVDTLAAGRQLRSAGKLVLLLRNDATSSPRQLSSIGPLLVPLGRRQTNGTAAILDRPSGQTMGLAMKAMGLEETRALTLARGCGRSLTALARLIPGGSFEEPPWLNEGQGFLPAILAGAWNSSNEMDRSIVERLAGGEPYSAIERRVRRFLWQMDPPFDVEGSVWKVRAPMDAFVWVGPSIDDEQTVRLRAVMLEVFSAIEPEPSPDELVGFTRPNPAGHSEWLRDGLATTFLLFAVWGSTARINLGARSAEDWANSLLGELPGLSSDPRVLLSLKNELPLLAEAAPVPLLEALERLLEGDSARIRALFNEQEGALFPTYRHTGVLWALEIIAWDPNYFHRAVMVLAGLAALNPQIQLGNTPANSLAEIFILWHPNTNATWAAQLTALKEICALYPSVGWALVKRLLPKTYGVSSLTAKPRLREAGASDRPAITYHELFESQAAVAKLAVELAGDSEPRWLELIPELSEFPRVEREEALKSLCDGMSSRHAR